MRRCEAVSHPAHHGGRRCRSRTCLSSSGRASQAERDSIGVRWRALFLPWALACRVGDPRGEVVAPVALGQRGPMDGVKAARKAERERLALAENPFALDTAEEIEAAHAALPT